MELEQDKINLIEKIIKNDRKYANNEDLYDDFFNETCKRSLLIIKTITSDTTLEAYLKKIVTTSILNVLKNEGRLRRSHGSFVPTKTVSIDSVYEIDKNNPDKNYLKLYYLRYEHGLTQKEISEELGLSQSEVSKRLFKLMGEIRQALV